jgi:hypothetical protein
MKSSLDFPFSKLSFGAILKRTVLILLTTVFLPSSPVRAQALKKVPFPFSPDRS